MEEGQGSAVKGATVDTENDLSLLADEKFDFDLSLSSSSANEDDEVFYGPIGHRERCVAASLELQGLVPKESEQHLQWSPPAGEKFVEIFKEARLLALQIESSGKKIAPSTCLPEHRPEPIEEFVQEARMKLRIFQQGQEMQRSPLALKRETYCVLTPEVAAVRASLTFADSPGTPEPASNTCLQNQGTAERKAPSRLQPPKALCMPGTGSSAKPQPGRQTRPQRLLTGSSRVSLGARPSDQSSSTSEASESSGSGSTKGLPAPSQPGVRKTLLKPPGSTRNLLKGKSTALSGPVCSVNPTLNPSSVGTPARGRIKPREPAPHLSGTPRSMPGPGESGSQLRRGSVSCLKPSRAAVVAAPCASQAKEPISVSLRQPQTPKTGIQRPSISQSSQLKKPKGHVGGSSGAKVGPPPTHPLRHSTSAGISPDTVPPRVQSLSRPPSLSSCARPALLTPARGSSGGVLQPLGCGPQTPRSVRRMSALPTPSRRRMSALPSWTTPRTGTRAASSPQLVVSRPPPQASPQKAEGRLEQTQETSQLGGSRLSDPPSVPPFALDFASPEQMASRVPGEEAKPAPPEAVLVDIEPGPGPTLPATPRPPLQPLIDLANSPEVAPRRPPLTPAKAAAKDEAKEGQPLIDLFHSPDVAGTVQCKPLPATGQLIDLSSPLISLSPAEDKENRQGSAAGAAGALGAL